MGSRGPLLACRDHGEAAALLREAIALLLATAVWRLSGARIGETSPYQAIDARHRQAHG